MKKKPYLVLLLLFSFVLFSSLLFSMKNSWLKEKGNFVFPDRLVEIGEEAFAGTAVKTLIFPEGLRFIGDNAFEDAASLTDAYIPETAETIKEDAFPENDELTIHGKGGSKAEEWAREHRVAFASSDIWRLWTTGRSAFDIRWLFLKQTVRITNPVKSISLNERTEDEGNSMRPQERAELNRIDYKFP